MKTIEIIALAILLFISLLSFTLSYFQYKEKGFLLNNAYLYASKEECRKMDKKPHYRQSAIAFLGIGFLFLLLALEVVLKSGWMYYSAMAMMVILLIYAIVSSIQIGKKYK